MGAGAHRYAGDFHRVLEGKEDAARGALVRLHGEYATEQGIISKEQGILAQEQGFCFC